MKNICIPFYDVSLANFLRWIHSFSSPLTYNTTPSEDFKSSLALVLVGYFPALSLSLCSTYKVHSGWKGRSVEKANKFAVLLGVFTQLHSRYPRILSPKTA